MADHAIPTISDLRQLLRYEPETGKLFWLERDGSGKGDKTFNAQYAGREAFTSTMATGYRQGHIRMRHMLAHRVIWAIWHGDWPKQQIDHVNGVRDDNRITNLRDVSHTENMRNRKIHKNNRCGVSGVKFRADRNKWRAYLRKNGSEIDLGTFATLEEAAAARKAGLQAHGFHANHGRPV